ncbi:MAG: Bug family tripartite tricarboxylate transporter substrate binding protein [Beijerinckiaceae bacterium]
MNHPKSSLTRRALLASAAALAASPGRAQAWPARPITLVVTFAAGGGVDVTSRIIAEALSEELGQRVVVENRGGGATMTGTQAVVNAAPDGYTLLAAPTTMVINPAARPNMPFDWRTDLVPIGLMAKLPFVVVTKPDSPVGSMKDLEALGKSRATPILFASGGTGTVAHLAGELFALSTGAKMQHVPYRGEGPSLADVASGQLDGTFSTAAGAAGLVQAGTLKALGVTTQERSALLPSVPTVAEQGYAAFDVSAWVGLMAPAKTSSDVAQKLGAALRKVLSSAALKEKVEKAGSVPAAPDLAFNSFLDREAKTWERVIREAGIKID